MAVLNSTVAAQTPTCYGPIFGKYGYELACVVNSLRSADAALGFVVHDNQLLCAPYEAVELIRRFILAEEHEIALDVYHALRRQCFAHYETGQVTPIASHLEALGLLSGQLGEKSLGELRALYRLLDRAVGTDGADDATFKVRAGALPAAAFLWQWGWFVHSIRLRESDPVRYATELASVLDHAHSITRFYGVTGFKFQPPPPTDLFKIFTADDAAAEIELACRGRRLNESVGRYTIDVLMRHGRDPQVVSELANALTWPATIQVRDTNDVDMDKTALDTLFLRNAIGSYLREPAFLHAPSTREVGPWEKRFLDAFSWLGATYGRLCRARRDAAPETLDTAAFLRILTFTLSDRSLWEDSYALPEAMFPLLMSRLCSLLREFAPHLAPIVSSWAIDQPDNQLGLYTEGYRAALWELAEGLSLCDKSAGRAVWRAYFANTVACAQNREERVPSLLACAQGASYFGDPELAEEALAHALKASMGPSWYKEDQFTLLVDALTAASQGTLTRDRWRDVVSLLEHASGDVTFQRFVRYEKASLVRHLGKSGRIVDALALVTNYLWPDQRTQLGRIRSWRADRVTSIDGGRWGVLEIERQAGALALLSGVADAPPRYRWAVIELFLPGDDRHFASFAKLLPSLFEAAEAEEIKSRLLRLLVADFVPEMRERFVGELRLLNDQRMNEWLQSVELEYDWAKQPVEADSVEPIAPPSRAISESAAERSPDDLFAPGLFGRQSGNDALEEAIATANARRDIGDLAGARDKFIEGLTAAQAAGWDIWGQNSKSRMALRSLFEIGSSSSAIQALRGVVLAEEYAVDWRVAGALVDAAVPKQETAVREEVVEAAFEHVATILAPETGSDVGYELRSLQAGCDLESSAQAIIMFLLSSLDDACCHFRDRAATALRWLLVSQPDFDIKTLLSHGIRRVGGHSRELCLGLLHSWFVERPDAARAALTALPDFWALLADPSFAVRYVATVVQESHPVGTSVSSVEMSPIDLGGEASQPTATAPEWQSWRDDCSEILRLANDEKSFQRAARHLSSLCGEFEPSQVVGLWRIRREAAQSKDFWSSPHEREAAWRAMGTMSDRDVAGLVDQFMWNPQWPDAALDLNREGVCDMIFGRIRDREFDDCFMVEGQLLLHAREASFDDKHQAASGLEIVAFLVPSVYFTSEFGDELLFERLSCHGPAVARPSIIATPIEPAVARFSDRRGCVGGSMTPAQPSRRFLELSRATPKAFQRASWRQGREWEPLGVGRPLRDGTILTVDRGVSLQLTGMDLAWCLFRNGSRVALVHPARRMVFAGDDL